MSTPRVVKPPSQWIVVSTIASVLPPGGIRTCLNSKLARAEFVVEEAGKEPRRLVSEHRAALELFPVAQDHGIDIMELPAPVR